MTVSVWRHPRPIGVAGRCIGRSDVPVDARKAKRLAHRIRQAARRENAPHVVLTSALQRGAAVGRWLSRWGWQHRIDPRLTELDFGGWDGRPWDDIGAAAVQAWCDDFEQHAPGGGESVAQLLLRCRAWLEAPGACYAVGHAGWISAALWLTAGPRSAPGAATWPAARRWGERVDLPAR